jgi:hypothetical protein
MIKRILLLLLPAIAVVVAPLSADDYELGFETEHVGYTFSSTNQEN